MTTALLLPKIIAKVPNPEAKKNEFLKRLNSFASKDDSVKNPGKVLKFLEIRSNVEKIFSPKTFTFEIHMGGTLLAPFYTSMRFLDEAVCNDFENLGKDIERLLMDVGYRETVSTIQEEALSGGSKEPRLYVPRGVLAGKITVEEAKVARELLIIRSAFAEYYRLENWGVGISILYEPLDDKGKTVRDPRPVDEDNLRKLFSQNILVEEAIEASLIHGWKKGPGYPGSRGSRTG